MGRARVSRWSRRLLAGVVLGTLLAGCGSFKGDLEFGPRIGFRPDEPAFQLPDASNACSQLKTYILYAENLKEAYRTRATQNRTWIYVAAIGGLGVAAASGALAAATAVAAGTLALLAISGGFTAAAFATIDNSELANVYTVAANHIGTALGNVQGRIRRCPSNQQECAAQLAYLTAAISNARNTLETARTSSAAGALARSTAQKTLLDQEITKATADLKARTAAEAAKKAKADEASATAAHDVAKAKEAATPAGDPGKAAAQREADSKKDAKDKAVADAKVAEKAAADAKDEADPDAAAGAAALVPVTCL